MTTLDPAERDRVLFEFNARANEPATPSAVDALVFAHVSATPDAVAVRSERGDLSYRALDARANHIARRLRALGVGANDTVGLCLERHPDLMASLLGILKAGGAYLPLEPGYPKARLAFMLEDAGPRVVLTERALADRVPSGAWTTVLLDEDPAMQGSSDEAVHSNAGPEQLAYVLYTSGSTGTPKGVCVPHRAIERLVRNSTYATLGPHVVILQAAPVGFDASTFEIWGALANGGCVALHPEPVPTARGLGNSIRRFGVTTMWLTAALFNAVIDEAPAELAPLSELLTGGEALSVAHIRRGLEKLPNTQLVNGYGPTETTTFAVCHRIPRELPADLISIPIGSAIRQTRLYVLDPERNPVAAGAQGELYIGGRGVALGYLRRPELTAERFLDDPFVPGERIYRTGDLVRYKEDRTIEYLGRLDQQVKIRGFRIELGEIEAALAKLPGVLRVVVTAREEAGDKRLVAYGVPSVDGKPPATVELRARLADQLPDYMIPSAFVWLPSLPVTPNGKVDYRALPAPVIERPDLGVEYVAPRSELEKKLLATWSELVGVSGIGVNDNLFDLGANSLLVVRGVARVRERHGLELPVVKVFQFPTVAGMAKYLDGPKTTTRAAGRRGRRNSEKRGVAIVGMAGRFPGADTVGELWQNLLGGVESISFFGPGELDPAVPPELARAAGYVPARGILRDAESFDAGFFGITPKEASLMDPQQRVLFEVAWEALESAGYVPEKFEGAVGVFAGKYNDTYFSENVSTRPDLIEEVGAFHVMIANEKDYVATRIAHRFDLRGPAVSVHTACSTSLVAVVQAAQCLELGQCDMALAGGASITVPIKSGHLYNEGAMLSADGHTRSFDGKAAGTVFSDGVAMVVLKRLDDAIADGDTIYGVVRGAAINNDGGNKASFTAPSVEGQAAVVSMALADAGVEARDIDYVEAHGTATPLGDPIEVEALTAAFRESTSERGFCRLGSIKSNLGHLVIAAGATGLIKTSLALTHRVIPANLHFETPNPKIDFEGSPFRVVNETTPWPARERPRLAGVSSFGVGGTNAHVIVEEPPAVTATVSSRKTELLLLSARSEAALKQQCERLAVHLEAAPEQVLADVAFTLHAGRREFPFRRAVVAGSHADAARLLRTAAAATRAPATPQDLVFMFPGQGAQHPGMGAALYGEYTEYRAHVEDCLSLLAPELSATLRRLVFSSERSERDDAELSETAHAQPALFICEYALAKLWESFGLEAKAYIGHSVGEFVAAALTGVMSLGDALGLVAERGRLMQAQPRGSMLSVRLPAKDVAARLPGTLTVAVENSPQLCVVAGPTEEIAAYQKELEAAGVACRVLQTSHAFHSAMMEPAVPPMRERLKNIALSAPTKPIASTVTGVWLKPEEATDREYWARQLRMPVRFATAAETLLADPKFLLLEVGPRRVLTTLVNQQSGRDRQRRTALASGGEDAATAGTALRTAAGELWQLGIALLPEALHAPARRVPLPTYPFERKRYWIDRRATPTPPQESKHTAAPPAAAAPAPAAAAPPPPPPPPALAAPIAAPAPATVSSNAMPLTTGKPHLANVIASLRVALEDTSGIEVSENESDVPFMELGLDSLFLTQFAIHVQKKYGVPITFRELQEQFPTLQSLAERLSGDVPPDSTALIPPPPDAPAMAPVVAAIPTPLVPPAMPMPVAAPQVAVGALPGMFLGGLPALAATGLGAPADLVRPVVEQQLLLMAQQLALLSGLGAVNAGMVARPAVAPAAVPQPVAAPAQPFASAPAGAAPAAPRAAVPAPAAAPASTNGAKSTRSPAAKGGVEDEAGGGMMKYDVKKAFGAIARIHSHAEALTPKQQARIDAFVRRYNARTKGSKAFAQDNRSHMSDPRVVTGFKPAHKELVYPIVVERSAGPKMWDIDGNEYVDALQGFGLNLFGWQPDFVTKAIEEQLHRGHEIGPQHPLTAEVARLMCEFTKFDRAAFCNTGSEAVMGCMRIARTVTGRSTIAIFTGSYHGIFDEVVVRGTKKLRSIPAAPGIMPSSAQNVLVLDYGTPESLEVLKSRADDLAAIMVEPVQSRRPDFRPREFLASVRELTERSGSVFIWDEVVCGFRVGPGGAQEYFGIQGDLASYGKVVGGGLPIGVIAGKRRFMDALDGGFWQFGDDSAPPVGVTYFAGTFVRHPLALAAARAVLLHLKEQGPELQRRLNERTEKFIGELNQFVAEVGAPIELKGFASLWRITYSSDQPFGDLLFYMMRDRGVHIWDGFPCFFTTSHTEADIAHIAKAFKESVRELQEGDLLPGKAKRSAPAFDASTPPVPGARLGRDPAGNPAWFVPNPADPGKYLRFEENA
jgi:amino acid adenylation domain-containing protein